MTELDETVCPVCGKDLHTTTFSGTRLYDPTWVVAHYLAHLVQQKAAPLPEGTYARLLPGDDPANPANWSDHFTVGAPTEHNTNV